RRASPEAGRGVLVPAGLGALQADERVGGRRVGLRDGAGVLAPEGDEVEGRGFEQRVLAVGRQAERGVGGRRVGGGAQAERAGGGEGEGGGAVRDRVLHERDRCREDNRVGRQLHVSAAALPIEPLQCRVVRRAPDVGGAAARAPVLAGGDVTTPGEHRVGVGRDRYEGDRELRRGGGGVVGAGGIGVGGDAGGRCAEESEFARDLIHVRRRHLWIGRNGDRGEGVRVAADHVQAQVRRRHG